MTDSLLMLAAWACVPGGMALSASLRERHERRFPDCVVCRAQKGAQEARKGPSERRTAAL